MSYTHRQFIEDLRQGSANKIGRYPRYFLTYTEGAVSFEAARAEALRYARETRRKSKNGWHIIGCLVNWDNPGLYCQDFDTRIPMDNEAK